MIKPVDLEELKRLLAVATRGQDGGYFITVIAPALIAELEAAREDVARLDWLDDPRHSMVDVSYQIRKARGKITTYRAAIDAARKEMGR